MRTLYDKKILILVLSCVRPPYDKLVKAQQDTWDAIEEQNVQTFYYAGDLPKAIPGGFVQWPKNLLQYDAPDDYDWMHWKLKLAFDTVWDQDWDIVFRTNSSSYVNKKRLKKFAEDLPVEKLYAGWTLRDTNLDGGLCVSGTGIFLSRDCVDILRKELKCQQDIEEDVLIGRILRKHGIQATDDQSRVDYPHRPHYWKTTYHLRFKSEDREKDIENMIDFHNKLIYT